MKTPKLLVLCAAGILFQSQGMPLGGVPGLSGSGSDITSSVPYLAPDGSCTAPAFAWAQDKDGTGSGWYRQAANVWALCLNGVEIARFTSAELRLTGDVWASKFKGLAGALSEYASQGDSVGHRFTCNSCPTASTMLEILNVASAKFTWKLRENGKMDQDGGDSSGTPGAATLNTPIGKSAIALGASSVVITNSLVTTSSQIDITPMDLDATLTSYKYSVAAGSFTVTGNVAATAAWKFSWRVSDRL